MNGLLLVNLGTPDAPTPSAVRRYLGEFLSDPRVLDMNAVGRWILLHGIILRTRPKQSAEAYEKVWTEAGSPLLVHGQALTRGVAERLGDGWHVELGMRYGNPSLADALARLEAAGAERIVVFPLYPQYASSSTGSTLERVYSLASKRPVVPAFSVVGDTYEAPGFIDAQAAIAAESLADFSADHVLFSFHGLPERQVRATDPSGGHCLASGSCCDKMTQVNRSCYRAQSFATARALATRMGLAADGWTVGFQSRLGKIPWIRPYTDELLVSLAERGVRRLAVLCPSFVADCLETLEEIGMRARETFVAAGGEDLRAVPCVNSHPLWIEQVAALAEAAS